MASGARDVGHLSKVLNWSFVVISVVIIHRHFSTSLTFVMVLSLPEVVYFWSFPFYISGPRFMKVIETEEGGKYYII